MKNRWKGASCRDDFWDGVLDTSVAECVAVLKEYLDAGARFDDDRNPEAGGLLSVSVCLMESQRVRRFRQRWRGTFGGEHSFSSADLIARQYPFDHLADRKNAVIDREHDRLVRAGVSLVRDFVISGSVASIWLQDLKHYDSTWIKGFGHLRRHPITIFAERASYSSGVGTLTPFQKRSTP